MVDTLWCETHQGTQRTGFDLGVHHLRHLSHGSYRKLREEIEGTFVTDFSLRDAVRSLMLRDALFIGRKVRGVILA